MDSRMKVVIIFGLLVQGSIAASLAELLSRQQHTNTGNDLFGNDAYGNDAVGNDAVRNDAVESPKGFADTEFDRLKEIDKTDHSSEVQETHVDNEKYTAIDGNVMLADDNKSEDFNTDKTEDQISILASQVNHESNPSENRSLHTTEGLLETHPELSPKSGTCHLRQSMAYGECGHVTYCPVTCSNETDCTFPYCDSKGQCQCRQAECSTDEMCEFFRIECKGTFSCRGGYCYCQLGEENEST